MSIQANGWTIFSLRHEKVRWVGPLYTTLGVTNNKKLTFKNHVVEGFKISSYILHFLCCIKQFLSKERARLLANAFINCQFFTFLYYGCLPVKVQLKKYANYILGHSKLLIMSMASRARSWLLSVMISMYMKSFVFWW